MRLIDADAFEEFIEKVYRPLCDDYHMKDYVLNQLLHDIENEPTVEAIPIEFIEKYAQLSDTEDSIEREKGDHYFGIEVTKTITL